MATFNAGNIKGADGRGIQSIDTEYAIGAADGSQPTSGWSTTIPTTIPPGGYLWTRITLRYTSGTPDTFYLKTVSGSSSATQLYKGFIYNGRDITVKLDKNTSPSSTTTSFFVGFEKQDGTFVWSSGTYTGGTENATTYTSSYSGYKSFIISKTQPTSGAPLESDVVFRNPLLIYPIVRGHTIELDANNNDVLEIALVGNTEDNISIITTDNQNINHLLTGAYDSNQKATVYTYISTGDDLESYTIYASKFTTVTALPSDDRILYYFNLTAARENGPITPGATSIIVDGLTYLSNTFGEIDFPILMDRAHKEIKFIDSPLYNGRSIYKDIFMSGDYTLKSIQFALDPPPITDDYSFVIADDGSGVNFSLIWDNQNGKILLDTTELYSISQGWKPSFTTQLLSFYDIQWDEPSKTIIFLSWKPTSSDFGTGVTGNLFDTEIIIKINAGVATGAITYEQYQAKISDAPINGDYFVRKDGSWISMPATGIPDAPSDNKMYGRKDGNWEEVVDPVIPTVSDAKISFLVNGTSLSGQEFTLNQGADQDINITVPINDATISLRQNGIFLDSFTVNQATNKTIDIGNTPNNATITFNDANNNPVDSFTLNQSANKTITLPEGGSSSTITIQKTTNDSDNFTLNQQTDKTIDLTSKMDKVPTAGVNNLAVFNSSGEVADSGKQYPAPYGTWRGSYSDETLLPTIDPSWNINDFCTVVSDSTQNNQTTMYRIIDSPINPGTLIWTFDFVYQAGTGGLQPPIPLPSAQSFLTIDQNSDTAALPIPLEKSKGGTGMTEWWRALMGIPTGTYEQTDFGIMWQSPNFGPAQPRAINQTYNGVTQVLDSDTKCVKISWFSGAATNTFLVTVGYQGEHIGMKVYFHIKTGGGQCSTQLLACDTTYPKMEYYWNGSDLFLRPIASDGSFFVNPRHFIINAITITNFAPRWENCSVINTPSNLLPGGAQENSWLKPQVYQHSVIPMNTSIAGSTDAYTFPSHKQVVDLVANIPTTTVTDGTTITGNGSTATPVALATPVAVANGGTARTDGSLPSNQETVTTIAQWQAIIAAMPVHSVKIFIANITSGVAKGTDAPSGWFEFIVRKHDSNTNYHTIANGWGNGSLFVFKNGAIDSTAAWTRPGSAAAATGYWG